MDNAMVQKVLRQEDIDKLKALIAEWETTAKSHIVISNRMDGIPGKGLVEYAGAVYMDCARKLSKEVKKLEEYEECFSQANLSDNEK